MVNKSGHDYSAAERFGRIVYLSEGSMDRLGINEMYRTFAEGLRMSQPDDYLLTTGLTQMNQVAAAVFGYMHGRLNLLIHRGRGYSERKILLAPLIPPQAITHDPLRDTKAN